jgi:hypothetical protein
MKPHAFVAMPFGVKKDGQGNEIDFNRNCRTGQVTWIDSRTL